MEEANLPAKITAPQKGWGMMLFREASGFKFSRKIQGWLPWKPGRRYEDGYSLGLFEGEKRGQEIGRKDEHDRATLLVEIQTARLAEMEKRLSERGFNLMENLYVVARCLDCNVLARQSLANLMQGGDFTCSDRLHGRSSFPTISTQYAAQLEGIFQRLQEDVRSRDVWLEIDSPTVTIQRSVMSTSPESDTERLRDMLRRDYEP